MWWKINIVSLTGIVLAASAAVATEAPSAPLLDHTHALQAHLQVEKWLAEGVVPPPELVPPIMVRGLTGVCITFRTSGFHVGEGQVALPGDGPADEPIDLAWALREAARLAIDELKQSLLDAERRSAIEGRQSTMPTQPSVSDVASRIQVDVQLADALEDIRIPPDAPDDRIYARFAPGFHGLRLTDPQSGASAIVWPATALAQNVSPTSQVVNLLSRIGRSTKDVGLIGRPRGLTAQRFKVFHVVETTSNLPPVPLVRGNTVLPPRTIDADTLDQMAASLADHLAGRFMSGGELRGTYHPTTGKYDPLFAEPDEALLTAYALTRHVRRLRPLRPDDPKLAMFNTRAQDLATRLTEAMEAGELEQSPAHAALILLTVAENAIPPRKTDIRDKMIGLMMRLRTEDGGFLASTAPDAPGANQTVTAIAVAGLAAAYEQTRRDDLAEPLRAALDHLWEHSQRSPNVNALPWLALAHERVAELLADTEERRNLKMRRDMALATMVKQLIPQQVVDVPRIGPADVIGGFELRHVAPDAPPNPNWTTAQLLMFLSISTRQGDVRAGQDELGWVLSAGLAARCLRQLQMQPSGCYYVRSPIDAIGGVRLAMWNNTMPLRATAMSLLAVIETQEMLRAFE